MNTIQTHVDQRTQVIAALLTQIILTLEAEVKTLETENEYEHHPAIRQIRNEIIKGKQRQINAATWKMDNLNRLNEEPNLDLKPFLSIQL